MKIWKEDVKKGVKVFVEVGSQRYVSVWENPPLNIDEMDIECLKKRYSILTTENRIEDFKRGYARLFAEPDKNELRVMRHALGLGREKKPYRNYFFCSSDDALWNGILEKGWCTKSEREKGQAYFFLNRLGAEIAYGKKMSKKMYEEL